MIETARALAERIRAEAEPLEGDYAGYASVSIDDLDKLVAALAPETPKQPIDRHEDTWLDQAAMDSERGEYRPTAHYVNLFKKSAELIRAQRQRLAQILNPTSVDNTDGEPWRCSCGASITYLLTRCTLCGKSRPHKKP